MITTNRHFENGLHEANNILFKEKGNIILQNYPKVLKFTPKSIHKSYNRLIQSFPYDIVPASDQIVFNLYAKELNYLIFQCDKEDISLSKEIVNHIKTVRKSIEIDDDGDKCIIYDYVDAFFHSLVYEFDKFIENAKKYHFFYGIESESVLLKNLLALYNRVLKDDSVQIDLITSITLTKELSDHLLKMLIDFIEQRLLTLNPDENIEDYIAKPNFFQSKVPTIKWNGSQENLIELFLELIEKKWINDIADGKRIKFAKTLVNLFDIESTKKNRASNEEKSLYQKLKGEIVGNLRSYPFMERENYVRSFKDIKENNKYYSD